jgi:hypothetical protein
MIAYSLITYCADWKLTIDKFDQQNNSDLDDFKRMKE